MERPIKVSIIIPVYNEENTLDELVERVVAVDLPGIEKEIIISDDGSTDHSPQIIQELVQRYPGCIRSYTSIINLGKGAAMRFGIHQASGDIVLFQDADLELDPVDYPLLLTPLVDGRAQVVYGSRFLRRENPTPRVTRLANRFLTGLTNLLYGGRLTDMNTGFRACRREVLQNLNLRSVGFDIEAEMTAKLRLAGYSILEVPIIYVARSVQEGKKIGVIDGIENIYTLFKYRFFH